MQRLNANSLQADSSRKLLGQQDAVVVTKADESLVEAKRLRDQQEKLFQQAHEQGLSEGLKDAERDIQKRVEEIEKRLTQSHQKAVAELKSKTEQFQQIISSLELSIEQHAADAEAVAVEVAFASVLRLLGDKSADRILMAELCHTVASEYGHGVATLHVSEADRMMFEEVKNSIDIEVDRRLKSGQCIIQTARGRFDCGIDVRLEALKKAFLSGLGEHRGQS